MIRYSRYIGMKPLIDEFLTDFRIQQEDNVMRAIGEVGICVDKPRLEKALTDARAFYDEGYRAAMRSDDVVQFPCKIGDTVYFKTYEKNGSVCLGVQPHKIVGYRLEMVCEPKIGCITTTLPDYEFGQSVFLTKEEAERVLNGGADNGNKENL